MGNVSDSQGQLTLQSVFGYCRISNSSELSCMSSLPVNMNRMGRKTAGKKCHHRFLDAQGQVTLWYMVGSGRITNSSKLLCMSSLPASMEWMQSRTAEKKWKHRFSHYNSMEIFFRRLRAANSAVGGRIVPNFKILRALMHVIVNCIYEKDRMKISKEKVATSFSPLCVWYSFVSYVRSGD